MRTKEGYVAASLNDSNKDRKTSQLSRQLGGVWQANSDLKSRFEIRSWPI